MRAKTGAAWLCLGVSVAASTWLESSMLRHMLIQLPLIFSAGCLLGSASATPGGRLRRLAARCDQQGIFGQTVLLLVGTYWMIPRALEQSLDCHVAEIAKFVSIFAAGALLPGALARANMVVQLFYIGNFCWMLAVAGLLYQDEPQRLCNAYLREDQELTGAALVAAAVMVAAWWCWRLSGRWSARFTS